MWEQYNIKIVIMIILLSVLVIGLTLLDSQTLSLQVWVLVRLLPGCGHFRCDCAVRHDGHTRHPGGL